MLSLNWRQHYTTGKNLQTSLIKVLVRRKPIGSIKFSKNITNGGLRFQDLAFLVVELKAGKEHPRQKHDKRQILNLPRHRLKLGPCLWHLKPSVLRYRNERKTWRDKPVTPARHSMSPPVKPPKCLRRLRRCDRNCNSGSSPAKGKYHALILMLSDPISIANLKRRLAFTLGL